MGIARVFKRETPPSRFLKERFGRPVRAVVATVTVLTTVTRLVAPNPGRLFFLAMNRSVNDGAVDITPEITFASGFFIGNGGGSVQVSVEEDGETVAWEWFAINQTASGSWRVYEVIAL